MYTARLTQSSDRPDGSDPRWRITLELESEVEVIPGLYSIASLAEEVARTEVSRRKYYVYAATYEPGSIVLELRKS